MVSAKIYIFGVTTEFLLLQQNFLPADVGYSKKGGKFAPRLRAVMP
jgi:hypothetical protein